MIKKRGVVEGKQIVDGQTFRFLEKGSLPCLIMYSTGLTLVDLILTRTSPAARSGKGWSTYSSTSGPPNLVYMIAFIQRRQVAPCLDKAKRARQTLLLTLARSVTLQSTRCLPWLLSGSTGQRSTSAHRQVSNVSLIRGAFIAGSAAELAALQ